MMRLGPKVWLSWLASLFGPNVRWGAELLADEIRLVRLDRRWKGWALGRLASYSTPQEASRDLNVGTNGFRLAASTLSNWIVLPGESLPESEESTGWELSEDPRSPSRWRLLWSPGELESTLSSAPPLDDPDEVLVSAALLPELLASYPPGHWIACRFLSTECMVWLMEGDLIHSFFRLNGDWKDEPLLRSEWNQVFVEELPRHWPGFLNAPIGCLEFGDPARLAEFLGNHTEFATFGWKPEFQNLPEGARFAAAAALGYGTPIASSIAGILSEDVAGRQKLALGALVGVFSLLFCLLIQAGLRYGGHHLQRELERQKMSMALPDSLWRLWQADQEQRHRLDARLLQKERSGGQLAELWTKASACFPQQLWIARWDGHRDSSRWVTSMEVFHPSGIPSNWAACVQTKTRTSGFVIRTGQTVSANEWGSITPLPIGLTSTQASNEGNP